MAFSGNLPANPVVSLVGAAIPSAYTTVGAARFQAGAARKVSIWIAIALNGGSSITALAFKLSARYSTAVAGSEVDLATTDATSGTGSTAGAFSYTVSAGNTYYKRLDCLIADNVPGDFVVQLQATGSPNAADTVTCNVVAW